MQEVQDYEFPAFKHADTYAFLELAFGNQSVDSLIKAVLAYVLVSDFMSHKLTTEFMTLWAFSRLRDAPIYRIKAFHLLALSVDTRHTSDLY